MSSGHVVEPYYHQKHPELRSKVEEIHSYLTQRYDQSGKIDLLEDVPVSQESLGDLVDTIKEKIPSDETSHKEYQKRQTAGWNSDYQSKDNRKDE